MLPCKIMASENNSSILAKLGIAIDASLAAWEEHLATSANQETYEAILSNDIQNDKTKTKALVHLLETLPIRHAALVIAYQDPKIKFIKLETPCGNLLAELQDPKSDVELGSWFSRILPGKKLVKTVSKYEADIKAAEQGRLQELRRLKASHAALTMVSDDGELGANEVGKLLDAMEEIGISLEVPGAFIGFGDEMDECLPVAVG